jgi:tetratricopeptide (TPR) repeat protein
MASKSKASNRKSAGFGTKSLAPELQTAESLIIKQKWAEARNVLDELSRLYPDNSDILSHLVNCCYELKDFSGYERACEMLVKADPKNAGASYSLAGARYPNLRPILALQAFQNAVNHFPNHEKAADAREMISELEGKVDKLLTDMNLTRTDGWEIAVLHERAQAYLAHGELEKARKAEEELLILRPDFIFSYNNLSLISFTEGNLEQAIVYSQKALDVQPDNIHALSNLTRYWLLKGDIQQAETSCEKLKNSQAPGWDIWTKKAEALSFFGDDKGILRLYDLLKAKGELENASLTGFFPHFVAVAFARQGKLDEARKLWKQALNKTQASEIVQQNLDDLKKPVGERHAPWALPLSSWITKTMLDDLLAVLSNSKLTDEQQKAEASKNYFEKHPHLINLVPMLLDRGDPKGREFAIRLVNYVKTPELLTALRDFALGQRGTDKMRYQTAITLSEAGILPQNSVNMWLQGKCQEVSLFKYELHDEPTVTHSRQVKEMAAKAVSLMKTQDANKAQTAEEIFKKALEIEPNSPDLLNNLAGAYQVQGRTEEVYKLLEEISERFPDYVFSRVSLARLKISEDRLEEAEAILKPLMQRKRFHFSEFGNFCNAQIELLIAKKDKDGARAWLQMWQQLDSENPELMRWQFKLGGDNILKKLAKLSK